MNLAELDIFIRGGVLVYVLPAHTSGKTQPLDLVAFSVFKNEALNAAASMDKLDVLDTYGFCSMLRSAYHAAFTRSNIQASFRRSQIWPLNPIKVLGVPRPLNAENMSRVLTVPELEVNLDSTRRAMRTFILVVDTLSSRTDLSTQPEAQS